MKRTKHQGRPSLYADDYVTPAERAELGDIEANHLARERHLQRAKAQRHVLLTEDDVAAVRPKPSGGPPSATRREILAWRRATLAGAGLPWRDAAP